jgi:hypothetical protein
MKNITTRNISKESQILIQETTKDVCDKLKINYSKLKSKQRSLLDRMIVALIKLELEAKEVPKETEVA